MNNIDMELLNIGCVFIDGLDNSIPTENIVEVAQLTCELSNKHYIAALKAGMLDDRKRIPYNPPSVLLDEATCQGIDWKALYGF